MIALLISLAATPAASPQAYDAIGDVARVFAAILKDHLKGAEPAQLSRKAIDAMIEGLDPWSRRVGPNVQKTDPEPINCLQDRGVLRLHIPRFDGAWAGRWLRDCPGLNNDLPVLIDLRGNAGGSVADALALADLFVAGGILLIEKRRGGQTFEHRARPAQVRFASLTLLIDKGTASAAEMIAAALRQRVGALVLGQTSMGKASVQRPIKLASGGYVLLSVGKLSLANGQQIDGLGLKPDDAMPKQPMRVACQSAGRVWGNQGCMPSGPPPSPGR
jgi:hypothetical protein